MTRRELKALLTDSDDMLPKLRPEKREPAELAAAESGEVDNVDGEGDDGVKAVLMRRRELRGWRGWNLFDEGILMVVLLCSYSCGVIALLLVSFDVMVVDDGKKSFDLFINFLRYAKDFFLVVVRIPRRD